MNNKLQDSPHTAESIREWMTNWLARELQLPSTDIAPDENLLTYGMDSINAIMLVGDLEDHLGLRLPPTLVWDFPTVNKLVEKTLAEHSAVAPSGTGALNAKNSIQDMDIAEAKQLLERLDELSDSEVEALLARLSQEG